MVVLYEYLACRLALPDARMLSYRGPPKAMSSALYWVFLSPPIMLALCCCPEAELTFKEPEPDCVVVVEGWSSTFQPRRVFAYQSE